jgi:hypothetical protein
MSPMRYEMGFYIAKDGIIQLFAYFPMIRQWLCEKGNRQQLFDEGKYLQIGYLATIEIQTEELFSLSLFIKNSNLVYTNKPFVSNLICYCECTKYLFYTITLVLIILVHGINVNWIYTLH